MAITNIMTVDVEDYYHVSAFDRVVPRDRWDSYESRVEANTDRLLAMFNDAGVRATFFVLGWVCERFPQLVRRIAAQGHELASHGYGHRLVYEQSRDAFREDIRRSKGVMEDVAGVVVRGYRAPSFSITRKSLWALDILIDEGFLYDASIFPIHHDRYGIPYSPRAPYVVESESGTILEIPASTLQWGPLTMPIAGGGYFRILPYAWTRWGVARLNTVEQRPVIFYLHPWEIDADQPRLPGSAITSFRHRRNLGETESRLRSLLREFAFGTVSDVLRDAVPAPAQVFPVEVPAAW